VQRVIKVESDAVMAGGALLVPGRDRRWAHDSASLQSALDQLG
jgi:hypothetical protein